MPSLCKVPEPLLVLVNTTKSWEARRDFWSDCGEGFWGVTTWALWYTLWSFQTGCPMHPLWAYPQLNPGFSSEIKNTSVNTSWYRLSAIMGLFVFWYSLSQSLVTNKQGTLSAHPTWLPWSPLWRVMLFRDGRWEGLLNHRLLMAPPWPGLPQRLYSKESACQCRRHNFNPWVGKIPWRRKQQSHSSILAWKSHGQRSLVGCSPWSFKRVGLDWVTKQWKQNRHDLEGQAPAPSPAPALAWFPFPPPWRPWAVGYSLTGFFSISSGKIKLEQLIHHICPADSASVPPWQGLFLLFCVWDSAVGSCWEQVLHGIISLQHLERMKSYRRLLPLSASVPLPTLGREAGGRPSGEAQWRLAHSWLGRLSAGSFLYLSQEWEFLGSQNPSLTSWLRHFQNHLYFPSFTALLSFYVRKIT